MIKFRRKKNNYREQGKKIRFVFSIEITQKKEFKTWTCEIKVSLSNSLILNLLQKGNSQEKKTVGIIYVENWKSEINFAELSLRRQVAKKFRVKCYSSFVDTSPFIKVKEKEKAAKMMKLSGFVK